MHFTISSLLSALVCATLGFASAEPASDDSVAIVKRSLLPESIPQIITNATNEVHNPLNALIALTTATDTTDAINAQLLPINEVLVNAVLATSKLDGQPLSVILLDVDQIIVDTVSGTANIVATLVSTIVTTFDTLQTGGLCLGSVVISIDANLAALIEETTTLVSTLLTDLTPITEVLRSALEDLGMTATEQALGLD